MLYFSVILLMACAIGSLNVNGLRDYHKRDLLFNYLTRKKIAVICLQETHSVEDDEMAWRQQ